MKKVINAFLKIETNSMRYIDIENETHN